MKVRSEAYLPELVSIRNPPVNLKQEDRHLFEHEFRRVLEPAQWYTLDNVIVNFEGVVSKNFTVFPEAFTFQESAARYPWYKHMVKTLFLQKKLTNPYPNQEFVLCWDEQHTGYFHFICDVLPRIYLAFQRKNNVVFLIPPGSYTSPRLTYWKAFLQVFQDIKTLEIADRSWVAVQRLHVPGLVAPTGRFREELFQEIKYFFVEQLKKSLLNINVPLCDKIYISRSKALKRKILNEEEIIPVLKSYGYQIIHWEDFSVLEQIKIAQHARYWIGIHGANLTNIFFAPKGSVLVEIRTEVNKFLPYFNMTNALGYHYYYLHDRYRLKEDLLFANLHVDPKELEEILSKIHT